MLSSLIMQEKDALKAELELLKVKSEEEIQALKGEIAELKQKVKNKYTIVKHNI